VNDMTKGYEKVGPMQVRMKKDSTGDELLSVHFGLTHERAEEVIADMNEHKADLYLFGDISAFDGYTREEEAFAATILALHNPRPIVPDKSMTGNEVEQISKRILERVRKRVSGDITETVRTAEIVKTLLQCVENDEEFKLGVWYLLPMLFVEVEPNAQAG